MSDPPDIDGRRRDEVREHLESMAPYYTDTWDPDSDDPGRALLATFSELAVEVLTRLDRVPEKQFVAFLDSLGFNRQAPRASRLPLVVDIADDAGGNVAISAGTQAVAEGTDERSEQVFEVGTDDGFEATPANVAGVYSVDPAIDAVFDHEDLLSGASGIGLFRGENRQEHVLYVGDDELLNLGAESTIRVTIETNVPVQVLKDCLVWEFYGEMEVDGEMQTGWHALRHGGDPSGPCPWSELRLVETFLEGSEEEDGLTDQLESYATAEHPPETRTRHLARIAAAASGRASRATTGDRWGDREVGIPRNLLPPEEVSQRETEELRRALRELRSNLREISKRAATQRRESADGRIEIALDLPGTTTDRTVSGIESRWIRCRPPEDDLVRELFEIEFRAVEIEAGRERADDRDGLTPDAMLSNDVPLPVDGDGAFYPFGPVSQPRPIFYVASEEAFTKRGTTVTVEFEPPAAGATRGTAERADVSWEYWNGDGWRRLPLVEDRTEKLTEAGAIRFEVPTDLEATSVSGHEGHWIRARQVGGAFRRMRYEEGGGGTWELATDATSPQFSSVILRYAREDSPDHLVRYNNLTFDDALADGGPTRFRPFVGLSEEVDVQTLYIGFDKPLEGGPITLYCPLRETGYPDGFEPRLRWEYCEVPEAGEWAKLDVQDETRRLRQTGLFSLVFPEETTAVERFGQELHWIRVRVTQAEFASPAGTYFVPSPQRDTTPRALQPYRPSVGTEPSTDERVATPPKLRGLYPNAGWAYNRRTVTEEVLGSSDGTQKQRFAVDDPPMTADRADVWVDELPVLPAEERQSLAETRPSEIDAVTGSGGELRAFWVQWHEVADFLGSGAADRHYTLDRTTGRVTFGDGSRGKIPPRGRDNIRANYKTGGGSDGNVGQNAVTGLRRSIPFVDGVTNPEPAAGGADEESMEDVRRRAPRELRDRRRAVLAEDFERIAMDAAGELTRAKCVPGLGDAGNREVGWVTVLIVPNTLETQPVPSVASKRQVMEAVREQATATVGAGDRRRLVVRGPSFVEISVDTTIEATAGERSSALEASVDQTVSSFLHPLSGGHDGDGWDFGTSPRVSDLYALLEGIDGVDHVSALSLTFEGTEDRVRVLEGDPHPRIRPDALVSSGTHDITVTGGI